MIYFDHASTTPMCDAAAEAFLKAARPGNPSSLHRLGLVAAAEFEAARKTLAEALHTQNRILFTSGGTEANNLAVLGAARARKKLGRRIVSTAVEHSSVLEPLKQLEREGFEVVLISPGPDGHFAPGAFFEAVNEDTVLISAMWTNNETGAYSPLGEIVAAANRAAERAKKRPLVHCDAVQAFGKEPIAQDRAGIDLLTVSAHKVFGPKGIGALSVPKNAVLAPLTFGGGQQDGLRPGTEPAEAAAAFAAAVREFGDTEENRRRVRIVRERIVAGLKALEAETGATLPVHSPADGSPYVLNFSADTVRSETMLHFMESHDIYLSSGSACAKGGASHVLKAMGVAPPFADSALRLSFSKRNTPEEADEFLARLRDALLTLARPSR